MCLQCNTKAVKICDVFGEWFLYQATADDDDWKKGQYGLLTVNDPEFVWEGELVANPYCGLTDKERQEKYEEDPVKFKQLNSVFMKAVSSFQDCISMDSHWMQHSYKLINDAKEVGYDPESSNFAQWFIDFLAKKVTFQ